MTAMKALFVSAGCVFAWFVLLPLLVAGGFTLLAYSLCAELAVFATGNAGATLDTGAAHEIARRVCVGCRVPARAMRRRPTP